MTGFAILLKNIRKVEKLKRVHVYILSLFTQLEKTVVVESVCACVCEDLCVKLLKHLQRARGQPGSSAFIVCLRVYIIMYCVFVHVHLLPCVYMLAGKQCICVCRHLCMSYG